VKGFDLSGMKLSAFVARNLIIPYFIFAGLTLHNNQHINPYDLNIFTMCHFQVRILTVVQIVVTTCSVVVG
jgi:hypothetical protein